MYRTRQLVALCGRLPCLRTQPTQQAITHVSALTHQPACLKVRYRSTHESPSQQQILDDLVDSLTGPEKHEKIPDDETEALNSQEQHEKILNDITKALKSPEDLLDVLKNYDKGMVYMQTEPIILREPVEKFFKSALKKIPVTREGLAILKFVCNHCVKDSDFERALLQSIRSRLDIYNALDLAKMIQCVQFVNTDERWTFVKTLEREIKVGILGNIKFTQLISSLTEYKNTPLEPYLLDHGRKHLYRVKTDKIGVEPILQLIQFHKKPDTYNIIHYHLIARLQMKFRYKLISYDMDTIRDCWFLIMKYEFINLAYFRFLKKHMLVALREPALKLVAFKCIDNITESLVSCAMVGYRDDELIGAILKTLKKNKHVLRQKHFQQIYCALNSLNYKDLSIASKWNYDIVMGMRFSESKRSAALNSLIQQRRLDSLEVKQLFELFSLKLKSTKDPDHNLVRTFYTLKAYSELVLKEDMKEIIEDEAFQLLMPPVKFLTTPLKESVLFVTRLLAGDESLVRSLYLNQYSHCIDADFCVDDEGTVRPEHYEGPLTRIIVKVLNQPDVILVDSGKDKDVHYEPRGPMKMLLHHLKLAEPNAEIITINCYEWNAMENRLERLEFLKAAIQSKIKEKQTVKDDNSVSEEIFDKEDVKVENSVREENSIKEVNSVTKEIFDISDNSVMEDNSIKAEICDKEDNSFKEGNSIKEEKS